MTVLLAVSFVLLSGFRTQTIIHDDGSETQDVLKVAATAQGQESLKSDADEFQKRNYMVMDYSNDNGEGFRALKTITNEGANKSSVDRVVHKTHDGLLCTTYYIDYAYTPQSIAELRWGKPMPENGVDLEYIVSFPSGTGVTCNSTKADEQGSTYMWRLRNDVPSAIRLQATVWHKLFIYIALLLIILWVLIVFFMEHKRRNVISWKQAAHLRRLEGLFLLIPLCIVAYMGYEYYVGTHITAGSLAKVSQQQQEELVERREEDKKVQEADTRPEIATDDADTTDMKTEIADIAGALRRLNQSYQNGELTGDEARRQARDLIQQMESLKQGSTGLSQANQEIIRQVLGRLLREANRIGQGDASRSLQNATNQQGNDTDAADTAGTPTKSQHAGTEQNDSHSRADAGEATTGTEGE